MKIVPKPNQGCPGFRTMFRHPVTRKVSTYGLGTQDFTTAEAICNDVIAIFQDPELLKDSESPRLIAYKKRAREIVFGKDKADDQEQKQNKPVLDDVDIGTLSGRIVQALNVDRSKISILDQIMSQYESRRYKQLQDKYEKLEDELKALRPRCESAEAELSKQRRLNNLHVKIRVGVAVKLWESIYDKPGEHAKITISQAKYAVKSFVSALPEKDEFKLADVKSKHIDVWLRQVKGREGQDLTQITKKKMKAYVSSFFTWAVKEYDLSENPINNIHTLAGVGRYPENILAIDRQADLEAFISGLSKQPYWQAWCAIACLAGPRWSEQADLKMANVFIEDGYIKIFGGKTGRWRRVPIESTTLKQILTNHIEVRKAEQKKKKGTDGEKSEYLFPTIVPDNEYSPRELTPAGRWSSGSVFLGAWKKAYTKATEKMKHTPPYWSYGPSEWRHTFGTVLGMCGFSSLEISRWMGNSSAIAERHYVATGKDGTNRWPYKY